MASTVSDEQAGSTEYQQDHMNLIFRQGLSFSGFERNNLFMNLGGKKFKELSGVSGIDSVLDGRAVVLADFDNDGDLDVFVTTIQGQTHLLYRNNVGHDNHFLRITLKGTESGKDAFGTVVRVKTSHGIQTQVKSGGSGFLAQQDPRLLFGLGQDQEVEWIEVRWPSGKKWRHGPVAANTSIRLVEGENEPRPVQERAFRLPDPLGPEAAFWASLKIQPHQTFPELRLIPVNEREQTGPFNFKPEGMTFINLWATWCIPCQREMPHLEKLRPTFEERGIQLIGISLDQDADVARIRDFGERLGVTYPLFQLDASGFETLLAGESIPIPFSILVDNQGRAVDLYVGWSGRTEQRIRALLGLD